MISRARWQQIQSLFKEAADSSPAEGEARLAHFCGDEEDPLLTAIGEAAGSLLEVHRGRLLGTRISPYRVVSILGYGGMSTVYRGERDDLQYRRTVAIKVMHHAALHPRLWSRLRSERHILATLDHPSIARLIDSGELEDGTPYLVMEHVDGESIDSYCDSRNLLVRDRLKLFVQVCAAVQYAHRHLVVHRDIKPANVFVTADGTAKLLDFGIAKLLAPESFSHTIPVTRLQERILTPENAAPEQVLGTPITVATDIYSLGVLLYELLTGRSPYRLSGYNQPQLERAICVDEPIRPSQMVVAKLSWEKETDRSRISDRRGLSPQRLRARLSGDLDAIVAMAMRKEPERRYASVQAFADDLNRHLLGRPVLARQRDWRYSVAKFLHRHVLATLAAVAVFLGLAAVTGVTLWLSHRIELAHDATAQERDRAQRVSALLVDVFSQADPFDVQGREPTAKDLLDRGAEKILGNASLQPAVRAELLESIGLAYRRQGLSERAIPLLEKAVAIRREEIPRDDHRAAAALANLAQALTDGGRLVPAEAYLRQALQMSRASDYLTGYYLDGLARLYWKAKQLSEAESYARQALAVYAQALPARHLYVASTRQLLGDILLQRGAFAGAETELRIAVDIDSAIAGADSWRTACAQGSLGWALILRNHVAEGEFMLVAARHRLLATLGAANPATVWATSHLAAYLRAHHRDAEAAQVLGSARKG